MNEPKLLNILQRINLAMQHNSVKQIKKTLVPNLGYLCFTAEDVINGCKPALADNGIVFRVKDVKIEHSQYDKTTKNGTKTVHYFVIQGIAEFVNMDNKDDFFETAFYGSAEDDSDKAIGKANTYAKKIALMNTFLVQDGEDTDAIASEEGSVAKNTGNSQSTDVKKFAIEIKTNNEPFIKSLTDKGFKHTKAYKTEDMIYKKWVSLEEKQHFESNLKNSGYFLNNEKGYFENNFSK